MLLEAVVFAAKDAEPTATLLIPVVVPACEFKPMATLLVSTLPLGF